MALNQSTINFNSFYNNLYYLQSAFFFFSNMRAHRGGRKASEKRRFIYYSIYAWGFPIILTSICALMQFHPDIPEHHVRPGFSEQKCWFDSKLKLSHGIYYHSSFRVQSWYNSHWFSAPVATSRYFYVPMMVLMICNMVLFGITAFKIFRIKQETAVLQNSDSCRHSQLDKDKQRYCVNTKTKI